MAALRMGMPHTADAQYDVATATTEITIAVRLTDKWRISDEFDSLEAAFMQELEDGDTPNRTVKRPSGGLQVNVSGANNLQVKWDVSKGCYRLTSVCVVCGRAFERTMRGFVTKDLIIAAHDLGYTLGEHAERHRSFGDHLKELQQQEKEGNTHKT